MTTQKTITITNIANENIEVSANDYTTFLEVVSFDNNRELCEIYTEKAGWVILSEMLDEIEQKEVDLYGEDFDDMIENLFENHLFADYFHA